MVVFVALLLVFIFLWLCYSVTLLLRSPNHPLSICVFSFINLFPPPPLCTILLVVIFVSAVNPKIFNLVRVSLNLNIFLCC